MLYYIIFVCYFISMSDTRFVDWTPHARNCISKIIDDGANKGNIALFDFDNTILCRDIGDATLAVLVRDGLVNAGSIKNLGSPEFTHAGTPVRPEDGVLRYLDCLLHATSDDGTSCSAPGYVWQTQLFNGLSIADIVAATRDAYRDGLGARDVGGLSVTTIAAEVQPPTRRRPLILAPQLAPVRPHRRPPAAAAAAGAIRPTASRPGAAPG